MKTRKKRLLSILTCVAMLVAMVPMNVFAADDTQLTAETDGVAKHYEVKSENGVGLTHITNDITYPDAPVYKISAHDFCDVGDTSTVSIRDLVDNSYVYSDNFDTGSFDYMDADMLSTAPEEMLQEGIKNYISLGLGYKNGSADFNKYTYLLKIGNNTYVVKDNELKASSTPAAFSENSYYGTGDILWYIDSHNAVLGTNLPAVVHNPATDVLDLSQAKFDKINIVIYKNGSVIETHNFKDLLDKPISINTAFTYNSDFKLNADGTITVKVDSTMSLNTQFKGENTDAWHVVVNNEYEGNRKVYTLDTATVSELQAIRTTVATYNDNILYAVLNTTNVKSILDYYETIKNNPVQPQVQTVTVTPTVSVVDMPADGTKTEGFDITFKSNVPVVLTTQEAPDTSVCSITTKQSDGSYTGVYHVGEVGNTDIKFNVKPTVASTMSDDGLTKTVYNSTSYTLKINAFVSDYETPGDITDDNENDTTTENTEDVTTEIKDVTLTEDNKVVSKDDMSTLITENATKDVVIKTPAGITLTFAKGTMKVVDGKDTYDFGVSISDDYSKQSDMGAVTKDNFVSLIDFEYSGNLPAEATIKIPVGADRAGQTLYYLLKTDTGYTLIQSAKVDDEGYITVKQDHCSTYVITTVDVSEKATVDKNDETTTDKNNETVPETETKKDTDTKKSDKDNNAVIYIVIAVIVVVVIAGVVVFVIYKKRKNETIEDITEDSIEETTENKTEE